MFYAFNNTENRDFCVTQESSKTWYKTEEKIPKTPAKMFYYMYSKNNKDADQHEQGILWLILWSNPKAETILVCQRCSQ